LPAGLRFLFFGLGQRMNVAHGLVRDAEERARREAQDAKQGVGNAFSCRQRLVAKLFNFFCRHPRFS
jgi:hypothetical protein